DATPGTAGGYRLGAGAMLPPPLLDDEGAGAGAIGLRPAARGALTRGGGGPGPAPGKLGQGAPGPRGRPGPAAAPLTAPRRGARRPRRSPRRCWRSSPPLPGTACGSGSATPATTTPRTAAPPNRITWSIPAAAGTCSPGTWPRGTGAPSAPTGSHHPRSPGRD